MRNSILIAVHETRAQLEGEAHTDIREMLRAAMRHTKDHWLITDEDEQFRAAVGACLLLASPEDKERLKTELAQLHTFSAAITAAQQGVPVNFAEVFTEAEKREDLIGLMKLWHEVKAAP